MDTREGQGAGHHGGHDKGFKEEPGTPNVLLAGRVLGLAAWVSGVWETYLCWEHKVGRGHSSRETLPVAPTRGTDVGLDTTWQDGRPVSKAGRERGLVWPESRSAR